MKTKNLNHRITKSDTHFFNNKKLIFVVIFLILFLRVFRFDYPSTYVFDEVYHAFTAKEYAKGNIEAWEYWTKPPPGVAYEWTHPPLAKEIMAISLFVFQTDKPWAWRLPGVLLGFVSIFLVYKIGLILFNNKSISLLSAFIFSLDGLNFVQSRTGMNDIYMVTFLLTSIYFLLKEKYFLSSLFIGLALSSKWASLYIFPLCILYLLLKRQFRPMLLFIGIPPLVYLTSYLPFFLQGHDYQTFLMLQQQIWWYHTTLNATHDYTSKWWTWPLNLYPVWYYVEYHKNGLISNIFASGNPIVFIFGAIAVILTTLELFLTRSKTLLIIVLGYFSFILPWALSPRIMFLYHYSPTIPFLSLALGYQLSKLYSLKDEEYFYLPGRELFYLSLILIFLGFIFVYPVLIGIPLPKSILELFFFTNLTKNPFG